MTSALLQSIRARALVGVFVDSKPYTGRCFCVYRRLRLRYVKHSDQKGHFYGTYTFPVAVGLKQFLKNEELNGGSVHGVAVKELTVRDLESFVLSQSPIATSIPIPISIRCPY